MTRILRSLAAMLPLLLTACTSPQPLNPSFAVTFSEASSALDTMKLHPHRLERPLVIVGGFFDFNVSPPLYKMAFQRWTGDDRIIPVSVGLCGSFDECRRLVIEAVDRACPTNDPKLTAEVDVVGASLGGLVARYAAAESIDPAHPRRLKIARLFTISSPHSGASLATILGFTQFHDDMRPGSVFLQTVARGDAAATYELFPYVRLHDEIVGERFASPPGVNPLWLPNPPLAPSHLGAMMDDRILADIARRLRGEAPFARPPAAPLPAS